MVAGTGERDARPRCGAFVSLEGDPTLLVLFQRAFPGPPTHAAETTARPPRGTAIVSDDIVKILDGNTFVVSDARGDIEASLTDPTGLFSFDTRFLSTWVLTVNGQRLNALSVDDLQYFETRFFLVPGTGTVYIDAKLSVIRSARSATDSTRSSRSSTTTRSRSNSPCGSRPAPTSRTSSRSRTRSRRRARTPTRVDKGGLHARLRTRDVRARDDDLRDGSGRRSTRRA